MRNLLITLGILTLIMGCGEKPCYEEADVFMNITFQTIIDSTGQPKDTVFDSLFVAGVGSNYILKYTKSYDLLLDINNDYTQFSLGFNNIDNFDEIVFTYKRRPFLISHECGFAMAFDSLQVGVFTNNVIDSVKITSSTVDEIKHENVKIFL